MPIEITVGPPVLTINKGNVFMVTDLEGQIHSDCELGIFADDTRFLSYLALSANDKPWVRLTSSTTNYFSAAIHLINARFNTEDGPVPENTIALRVLRQAGTGINEQLQVTNYGRTKVNFNLELAMRCDFADIFEVRNHDFFRRGRILTQWHNELNELHMTYNNRDFDRMFLYRIISSPAQCHFANGRVNFEISIEPGAVWEAETRYELVSGERTEEKLQKFQKLEDTDFDKDNEEMHTLDQQWHDGALRLTSTNEEVYRLYQQSVNDIGALRFYGRGSEADLWIPAAGVPWYVTLFGRDSLIVGMQTIPLHSKLALGVLNRLAEYQAKDIDTQRDAEPGKILHEIRFGELAHFNRIPQTPYYGSADSTPLYLILLHETWRWTGDSSLLVKYENVALRCLEWMEKYGDLDQDGFQEYQTRSTQGFENMGWKDSVEAVVYPDGSQVKQPKALCELQGYAFDALMRSSEVFDALGKCDFAKSLRQKASTLQKQFEERFWCDDIGFYAYALDPEKRAVKTVVSNVGHCLWSGIISPERAPMVVDRFLKKDMWSGWGIRTISSENPAFNPHSYHLGSVWPHDNGIIALGFKRYGFSAEVARVARDISGAASFFLAHRLPELYAGVERTEHSFPVQYLKANVPQGWASGSTFHLIQALLGLQADAPNGTLFVDPALPKWLPELTLHNLHVGNARLNIRFKRQADFTTSWDADVESGEIKIETRSWQPWTPNS